MRISTDSPRRSSRPRFKSLHFLFAVLKTACKLLEANVQLVFAKGESEVLRSEEFAWFGLSGDFWPFWALLKVPFGEYFLPRVLEDKSWFKSRK